MGQKIVIVGNSITAEIIYSYLNRDNRYDVKAFSVHERYIKEKKLYNLDVIPLEKITENYSTCDYRLIIAMGYNNLNQDREKIFNEVKELGYTIATYIHNDAKVYSNQIGEGSIVLANSVIEPYASIGDNSFIWANCTIAHHSQVQNHCWIASGCVVAGEAKVLDNCFLGVSSTIVNQVCVSKNNIIGANAMISNNTKENEVYLARSAEKHRFSALDYAVYFMK